MHQLASGHDIYRRAPMQWNSQKNAGFSKAKKIWIDQAPTNQSSLLSQDTWSNIWNQSSRREEFTVEKQEVSTESTLAFYKKLIALRNNDDILKSPEKLTQYKNTSSAILFKYETHSDLRWVILNLNATTEANFDLPDEAKGNYIDLFSGKSIHLSKNISLQAGELLILKSVLSN
jgi:glycosidase